MGCIKQILTARLFGEWYKIILPSEKFNLGLLFTSQGLTSAKIKKKKKKQAEHSKVEREEK